MTGTGFKKLPWKKPKAKRKEVYLREQGEPHQHLSTRESFKRLVTPRKKSKGVPGKAPAQREGEILGNEQELQPSGTVKPAMRIESAEINATAGNTKDVLLTLEMLKDGQSQNPLPIVTSTEDLSRESVKTSEINTRTNCDRRLNQRPPRHRPT